MSWYYAAGNNRMGPVEQAEFERLVAAGTITGNTLVWKEGMPEWKPYSEIGQSGQSNSRCGECGRAFPPNDLVRIDNRFICATCKPVVLQKLKEGVGGVDDERIRNEHLSHEASIKSVGALYLIGSVIMILSGAAMFIAGIMEKGTDIISAAMGFFFVALGGLQFYAALGLRKLKRAARVPTGIIAGIGLLGIPIGTLISAYILYLVFSQKGTTVFSDEYQQVMERTPHIKYKTSIIVWVLLGLVLMCIGFGLVSAFVSGMRHR